MLASLVRTPALLVATGAALLLPPARAPRLESTVVTGRVTAEGRPVARALVSAAGRAASAVSGVDGRFALSIERSARSERVTVVVRHAGYEPWQRAVTLRGDTVRVDVALVPASGPREDSAVASAAPSPKSAPVGLPTRVEAQRREGDAGAGRASKDVAVGEMRAPRVSAAIQPGVVPDRIRRRHEPWNTESYDALEDNPFRSPRVAPLSTFSVDVDRASYANVRRYLDQGALPPRDAVRIEELVNYFPYADVAPARGDVPLRITTEVAAAPWHPSHDLVRIALRARDVDMRRAPASNLVFLVDVSGSMQGPGRLPLVKQSLALLVEQLREDDHVAIVVYAGSAGLVLPSTSGSDKRRILAALDRLEAGGSTAGGAGLRLAYDVVSRNFVRGGNNRVILCTDGDFNVGQSSDGALVRLIEQRRDEGAFLTILGFGMGNYKDSKMEKLADAGNGNYAYIDDLLEARKTLVKEMGGTLLTVAKDVKLQVEFNPARVAAYRLLGYEDRLLRDEDFADDTKDAGDVGAGHIVTALYEVVRADVPLDVTLPETSALRYQRPTESVAPSDELLHVALRYKEPDGGRSRLVTQPVAARRGAPSESMRFASAVAGFGMLLRGSPYAGSLTWPRVVALARGARGDDPDGYRADFIRLAELAGEISRGLAAGTPVRPEE
ncbi:MAG TPA: von Willebrand factor type A domain-containing protein [Gemmatimonadaceae bacterium]|jgi:Ca-activated chloride channel family protein|nr:von Willebrand factor type A domain-containing protein [Gemmatimonadaceae bacterium]